MAAKEELSRLYDAHAAALFGYFLNLTRDETDTRDLLQSLFCQLARRPELVTGMRNERAFLLRMAHNATVDLMRRHDALRRRTEALAAESVDLFAATHDPDEAAFRRQLETALGKLPADQRMVVHLKLWEGLTFETIADILEVSPNTAASRYRYGLDKLRTLLRPIYDEIR